ncbi:helix-turn-helix domain-containing protein [Pararhizobium sp. DWP3-4]|uniref:helix-turn-helix domain-containing protein n=1 Tax=unclassified Pararhizobium TaxID=2643050 RepID=UPI003CF5669B
MGGGPFGARAGWVSPQVQPLRCGLQAVLQRMWDDGLSYRQVAAVFDIRNNGCFADWERRYERGGLEALAARRRGGPRSMSKPPAAVESDCFRTLLICAWRTPT